MVTLRRLLTTESTQEQISPKVVHVCPIFINGTFLLLSVHVRNAAARLHAQTCHMSKFAWPNIKTETTESKTA